jgi:hypothetical protein
MRQLSIAAAALLWSAVSALAADPVGTYNVEGTNPGDNSTYKGTVTIAKTGETYRVVWVVGGTRYIGTGIGNKDFIAVSYKSGDSSGLALYGADGGNWAGVWTYSGGDKMGAEFWKRQ